MSCSMDHSIRRAPLRGGRGSRESLPFRTIGAQADMSLGATPRAAAACGIRGGGNVRFRKAREHGDLERRSG